MRLGWQMTWCVHKIYSIILYPIKITNHTRVSNSQICQVELRVLKKTCWLTRFKINPNEIKLGGGGTLPVCGIFHRQLQRCQRLLKLQQLKESNYSQLKKYQKTNVVSYSVMMEKWIENVQVFYYTHFSASVKVLYAYIFFWIGICDIHLSLHTFIT